MLTDCSYSVISSGLLSVHASGRPQLLTVDAAQGGTLIAAGAALQGEDAVILYWSVNPLGACLASPLTLCATFVGTLAILSLPSGGTQRHTQTT